MDSEVDDYSSLSDSSVENVKEKKISLIEITKFLSRKRSKRKSGDANTHRTSTSTTGKGSSSKALSFKCALDETKIASMLGNPIDIDLMSCPSDNVGVRSMSIDYPDADTLGEFESFAFAEILQEAIDSLEVLKYTIHNDVDPNEKNERIITRKIGSCSSDNERKLIFGRDAGYAPVVKSISEKLHDDRNLACKVFQKVACELRQNGTYNWLSCEVNAIIESAEKEQLLKINRKILQDLIRKLRDMQKRITEEFEDEKQEYLEDIDHLVADIDAAYCNNRDKLDYIRRWEEAKLEQHNYRLQLHEESVLNDMKELDIERKRDAKVSEELQSYGKSAIYTCENEISSWTERYHEELERREQEINQLKETIEAFQESLEKTREVQRQRQEVIDEYMAEQKRMKEEAEYWKAVNEQATIIQSIWRGYMVRHRLGKFDAIFKEAAKRKKRPKSKKKKKKK